MLLTMPYAIIVIICILMVWDTVVVVVRALFIKDAITIVIIIQGIIIKIYIVNTGR